MSDTSRPRRPRLLAPGTADRAVSAEPGVPDSELLERLEEVLAALPAEERAAAVVAFGMAEGPAGVAAELGLSVEDADALTRSALQLLRGGLADLEPGSGELHPRLRRRRPRTSEHIDPHA